MRTNRLTDSLHVSAGLVGTATLLAMLAGCGSDRPGPAATLPPALLPAYGIGDTYQFGDGSADTVVATSADQVWWHGKDGSYITSRDVLMPTLAWTTGASQGERRIGAGGVLLFPLQGNASVQFTATRSVRQAANATPQTTQENWRCAVTGTARQYGRRRAHSTPGGSPAR